MTATMSARTTTYSTADGPSSRLSLAGKEVIVGYANQQDLLFAGAGVKTIASGNFRNVRRFTPGTFEAQDEEEFQTRGVWFYDGGSLSVFQPQHLGVAYSLFNMRGLFGPG